VHRDASSEAVRWQHRCHNPRDELNHVVAVQVTVFAMEVIALEPGQLRADWNRARGE
jgi:hypothetical protein